MSLVIYLDDCAFSHTLRRLLTEAGYRVQVPAEVNPPLTGARDEVHFDYARSTGQLILTFNPADFFELHQRFTDHPGILVVYQDNDPTRDMTYADIVQAISNLERTGVILTGGFWSLNAYQW